MGSSPLRSPGFGVGIYTPTFPQLSPISGRGLAIGIYRFWRDLGYAVGALGLGLTASLSGSLDAAFWFVASSMPVSGALLAWWGEEPHPGLSNCR